MPSKQSDIVLSPETHMRFSVNSIRVWVGALIFAVITATAVVKDASYELKGLRKDVDRIITYREARVVTIQDLQLVEHAYQSQGLPIKDGTAQEVYIKNRLGSGK